MKLIGASQVVLVIIGVLMLFLSLFIKDSVDALSALVAAAFSFLTAALQRVEQKLDNVYDTLITHKIVEEEVKNE